MSYDLYFTPRLTVPISRLKAFFSDRPNTTVGDTDADYDNPETGVHFMWWYGDPEPGEDADDPLRGAQATLSINFNRPTAFVFEAAREAAALARAFDMQAIDPQTGAPPAAFDADTLTRDYIASAERVTKGLLKSMSVDDPARLPRDRLNRIWSWNDLRDGRTDALSEDLFIPKIMLLQRKGTIETAVTWGDGVPMICPKVDTILCLRRDTAPTTGFFRKKRQETIEPMPFATFQEDFGDLFAPSDTYGGVWRCKTSDQATLEDRLTRRHTRNALPMEVWKKQDAVSILPFHAVLDEEFFA